jgi:hypothetical protein
MLKEEVELGQAFPPVIEPGIAVVVETGMQ